jgi:hypothetical protein
MGLPQIVVMGIAALNATAWVSLRSTLQHGYRFAQRYSMGIAALNAILRGGSRSVFCRMCGPLGFERSDTHQPVAQPASFLRSRHACQAVKPYAVG